MLKASAVKLVAAGACAGAFCALPAGWSMWAMVAIAAATVAVFAHAIAAPSSQFFAPGVWRMASGEPAVAFTFDDGPDPVFTPRILDLLRAHRAHATFFVLGERAVQYPDLIRRMYAEGHAIGTHTYNHRLRFHFGSRGYIRQEVNAAIEAVASILAFRPTLFRPPQGLRTPCFSSAWRTLPGLVCVTWSVRGLDSLATTANAIVERIARRLVPGAIIALHDGTGLGGTADRESTLAALASLLDTCRARGFRCVGLDSVVAPSAAS